MKHLKNPIVQVLLLVLGVYLGLKAIWWAFNIAAALLGIFLIIGIPLVIVAFLVYYIKKKRR